MDFHLSSAIGHTLHTFTSGAFSIATSSNSLTKTFCPSSAGCLRDGHEQVQRRLPLTSCFTCMNCSVESDDIRSDLGLGHCLEKQASRDWRGSLLGKEDTLNPGPTS